MLTKVARDAKKVLGPGPIRFLHDRARAYQAAAKDEQVRAAFAGGVELAAGKAPDMSHLDAGVCKLMEMPWARTSPSTILRHRPPVTRSCPPERSPDLKRYSPDIHLITIRAPLGSPPFTNSCFAIKWPVRLSSLSAGPSSLSAARRSAVIGCTIGTRNAVPLAHTTLPGNVIEHASATMRYISSSGLSALLGNSYVVWYHPQTRIPIHSLSRWLARRALSCRQGSATGGAACRRNGASRSSETACAARS